MNPIFYNIDIIRFKIRIITTQPMNKHPRIFPKAPHSSPLTPSAT